MKLMLFELIDIGFFQCFFSFEENPWLFTAGWIVLLLGAGLETLLLKKKKPWRLPAVLLLLCVLGEVLCQCITGIELLAALILYGLAIVLLMGAVMALILHALIHRRRGGTV
ncbi:MAG: hypothetical protein IJ411_03475 [Oscillospiraceae bacterium]|nr:hypothetical protein [Oscillospiraceae bacterium]